MNRVALSFTICLVTVRQNRVRGGSWLVLSCAVLSSSGRLWEADHRKGRGEQIRVFESALPDEAFRIRAA
jgi:hypothetical protein